MKTSEEGKQEAEYWLKKGAKSLKVAEMQKREMERMLREIDILRRRRWIEVSLYGTNLRGDNLQKKESMQAQAINPEPVMEPEMKISGEENFEKLVETPEVLKELKEPKKLKKSNKLEELERSEESEKLEKPEKLEVRRYRVKDKSLIKLEAEFKIFKSRVLKKKKN